jgi:ABC-2 type transport system ATP-binding protein
MTDAGKDIIVQIRNLTRRFEAHTAVDHIDLSIERGEIFGLVGPDGAGKTTTLRLTCGLLEPDEGQVQVVGVDVARALEKVKDHIGYMAQRFGLYGDLTVEENMVFYADLFGINGGERDRLMNTLLQMTRMRPFRSRKARFLSGGMKQKLALMCTLLHHPRVLFLDEPTNGVDPVSRRDFWAILYQLVKEGMTVMIATAYLDEAERCNRVGLMHQGRLVCCDSPQALRNRVDAACYAVKCPDQRGARKELQGRTGVVSVEPAGAALHLFLEPGGISADRLEKVLAEKVAGPVKFESITPSLEDIFIALIRKASHHGNA